MNHHVDLVTLDRLDQVDEIIPRRMVTASSVAGKRVGGAAQLQVDVGQRSAR
jgi:hypothetical protein